ncbi:formylglycine-generating enzyme family protein [Rhodoplanes sp. SY1]|uniref:formylglycine-generating enzyme family protein n=1 Tax=Rhodoplanes sp. SY1 TaxID=3166646 RepID=UPI0038B5E58A
MPLISHSARTRAGALIVGAVLSSLAFGVVGVPSKGLGAETRRNSIGMEFVAIPAGTFLMGASPNDREASEGERPRHSVTITKPFFLGRHEVTLAQWEAVMGSSPYTQSRSNPFYDLPGMAQRLRHPDNPATVSWNDAQEFIRRLNAAEGRDRYRLPTEAEWEYAARAGTTTIYSFGDDARDLGRHAWFGESFASGSTHAVGRKDPNPWGLYDIHGNVWEWVQDWYDERYYVVSPEVDPPGPPTGTRKVVRGGSWHETGTGWRSSARRPYEPVYRGISIGFRVVMRVD